jgi:tetratricopeptide (TPR) repeat protein
MRTSTRSKASRFAVVAALAFTTTFVRFASAEPTKLEQGLLALDASDYDKAEKDLREAVKGPKRGAAQLGLAKVQLATGKYADAHASAASAQKADPALGAEAASVAAEALLRQGKTGEAQAALEAVRNNPNARRARLLLGQLLIDSGRRADAQDPLMSIISDYNQNAIQATDAEGLTLVGRAAHLLRSARDANDAYSQAEKAGGKTRVETLLFRADLFLEKYDPGHAEEVVKEALKLAPHNPAAHVAMAQVKLDQALDFDAAEHEIKEALSVDPKIQGAFFVGAGLALRTMDLPRADSLVDQGLAVNPNDLELLSMKAAVRFLSDDKAGFEKVRRTVFAKNSEYTRFYQIVGEFADWEHRYDEIVAMMKEAVKLDPADAKAWADLGMNLIRAGDEQGGVSALRRAWDKDHFNVRVYNTLNLYEKDIATSYETVEGTPFRIRYSKEEKPILSRYVPAMLAEAWASMVKRYGFTPSVPIFIELYSTKQHFSIRTSGLPNVGIQGVCFGKTLAAMSPRAEPFNWGNVLWHELAHVFAIQLSKSRVPRWFTEGLSEYETIVRRPEWQREDDPSLYAALEAGRIPPVDKFNQAFTHADDARDVMTAYYAASQIQLYIASAFGMGKITEMLRLWGEGKQTDEVIKRALGITPAELDRRIRESFRARLGRYASQFVPDTHAPSLESAKDRAKQDPTDPKKQVELALALLAHRKLDEADAAIRAALAENPIDPNAHFLRARMLRATKNADEARQELLGMIRMGYDGYAVRIMLADLAQEAKNSASARYEFMLAHDFDPTMSEPLASLYDLDHKEKRDAEALGWLRQIARLDQHDRKAYRLFLEGLVKSGQFAEAKAVGESAVFVDAESHAIHTLYATALSQTGDHAKALFELDSALLCNPPQPDAATIHARMAKEHLALGNRAKAKAEQTDALRLDPSNTEAASMKIP